MEYSTYAEITEAQTAFKIATDAGRLEMLAEGAVPLANDPACIEKALQTLARELLARF